MKYLWLFFLVQGCWYYTYHQIFFYQNLAPWQRPARGDVSNQIAPSACDQSTNLEYFSSNNCQTSYCMCSDIGISSLFVTCLHFCLAPSYLCTCKSFFWYTFSKSRLVNSDHHDCKVQTNAGTEVEIPTQGRRALPPHLKKKIHFSLDIFILNCYCGWKVCTWCVFDVFRDWNVCQRWLRSAKVKGSCKEKNGHHYLHINLYRSCIIYIVYIN